MHLDSERARSSSLAEAAVSYAEHGWQVLPLWWPTPAGGCACGLGDCESAAKHPVARLVPHGLHDASSRIETVVAWWRSAPQASVGLRTGAGSDLVVLDVDGEEGRHSLRALVAAHGRFRARWARTGSGGWHAYFAHSGGEVPSSAGRLGAGLDVRGDGGYVVAPPSLHVSGHRYRWVRHRRLPFSLGRAVTLPPLPGWLARLAALPVMEPVPGPMLLRPGSAAAYAAAALQREANEVANTAPGQRNHRLNSAAFRLGQLVGAGLLEEAVAAEALIDAGLAAGPGERKIRSTVRRGIRAGMQRPRQVVLQVPP